MGINVTILEYTGITYIFKYTCAHFTDPLTGVKLELMIDWAPSN